MNSEREILGVWWLPDNTDEKWVGTLHLKPDASPRLTAITLKGCGQFLEKPQAPVVVNGYDESGRYITLLFPDWPRSYGGVVVGKIDIRAAYAVLGMNLSNHSEFLVNSVAFQMQYLYGWGEITGFLRPSSPTYPEIHVRYKRPEDLSFEINSDLSVNIWTGFTSQNGAAERTMTEDLRFEFASKKGIGLAEYKRFLLAIRHLLHFATTKPIYPLTAIARKDGHGATIDDTFYPGDIVICNSIFRDPIKNHLLGDEWIFKFSDVRAVFGNFMREWLEYAEKFKEALGCYSGTVYHRLPDTMEHLSLTQALDAYHGVKFQSHKIQDFGAKLRDLIEGKKPFLNGLVDDIADFVKTVVHNRNYYTHHNPKWLEEGRVATGGKLSRINEKLCLLFQMCVLADIGIPQDRFIRLRRQLATDFIDFV